jgi:hypothetical protein
MNRVKIHTVDQPDSDTTTFVLSCNRLDVLAKTLSSFFETQDYITKMVILDDSAEPGVYEKLVEEYGDICDVICFPRNRSQWFAMDFMVSWCDTEYIFYLEDDWELLRPGYLNQSKQILQKYREVGVVDTSWRTFEWQGIDSYHKGLVDDMFYWKKPWKITDHHLAWHSWVGSPNLRRRDDLIMLGRVEKWHNEWNIDRAFTALGFKGVFLNGEYSRHLGDHCSRMAGQRPDDSKVPYDFYPKEVLANRRAPMINFRELDWIYEYPADVTLVTMAVDISRGDRSFEEHYIKGLDHLLEVRNPLVVYADPKYHDYIIKRRKELSKGTSRNRVECRGLTLTDIEHRTPFQEIQDIITKDEWVNQSDWIKGSALANPYYIPLTLIKNHLLEQVANSNPLTSKRFYWIDSGMSRSFIVNEPISTYNFLFLPKDKFFLTSYPYQTNSEIHGCNINTMTSIVGRKPEYVCIATLFGGSKDQIIEFNKHYYDAIRKLLDQDAIGTEEAVYTMVEMMNPDLVNRYAMPNGDINNYLNTIRNR